ncbi:MAG: hypothetical protein ACYDHY_06870 [Acidiferrobacterales bacterium]
MRHLLHPSVDTVLVVPTIRENCFKDFLERWSKVGLFQHCDLIVMEDNPKKTFKFTVDGGAEHYCWEDIEKSLGSDSWIIPRRSDTVRSYGYLKAARAGYKFILTLDDDCYPCTEKDGLVIDGLGFINNHKSQLIGRTRWFNTLNSVKPRGVPFYNKGKHENVMVNHGLWMNVLDYDAPTQLVSLTPEKFSFDNKVVPANSYFPFCGMNVMWKAEVTVLMYHLLMGQHMGGPGYANDTLFKLPFDRFGDIWCGILMKKILDTAHLNVSTGMPYIHHERASNVWANLKKECQGLEVNEKFWEHVDVAPIHDTNLGFAVMYDMMGKHVAKFDAFPEYVDYFKRLGEAMQIWAALFAGQEIA